MLDTRAIDRLTRQYEEARRKVNILTEGNATITIRQGNLYSWDVRDKLLREIVCAFERGHWIDVCRELEEKLKELANSTRETTKE